MWPKGSHYLDIYLFINIIISLKIVTQLIYVLISSVAHMFFFFFEKTREIILLIQTKDKNIGFDGYIGT